MLIYEPRLGYLGVMLRMDRRSTCSYFQPLGPLTALIILITLSYLSLSRTTSSQLHTTLHTTLLTHYCWFTRDCIARFDRSIFLPLGVIKFHTILSIFLYPLIILWTSFRQFRHIKLCLLLWFEFFRTIALLLGALRDLIAGYSKLSAASVECRQEIFGLTNFHLRVVSLGINVSSTLGDDEQRMGEGPERCCLTERGLSNTVN